MNFTAIQTKPLQHCLLSRLKKAVATENSCDETPAKVRKVEEETPPALSSLDGLIIASKAPNTIAKELVKLVAPSGNFVVYSPYLEVHPI